MDLKGSLIDTNVKIYPSKKLLVYLEALTIKDVPENIANIVAGKKCVIDNLKEETTSIHIDLNNADIAVLNQIKKYVSSKNPTETNNENFSKKFEQTLDHEHKLNEDVIKSSASNKEYNKSVSIDEADTSSKIEKEALTNTNKKNLELNDGEESKETEKKDMPESETTKFYLTTKDINWLYTYLQKERKKCSENNRKVPFLHELLEDADIDMPSNKIIKRNPQLEARCVKLRAQQEAREYRKMTKTVDNVRISYPEDSISYQMKQLNRQLIAIGQFILSIFAGFMFGFRGVQWMAGNIDFGVRMLLGVMCALIIALAEIYFLAKKLNEELSASQTQTIQIGGPPKLASDQNYFSYLNVPEHKKDKPHQD